MSRLSPQDSWQSTDRLTINAGVRVDFVRGYPRRRERQGSIDDSKVYKNTKNWAPRLGIRLRVRPTGNGKTGLKGHYRQYYEAVLFVQYQRAIPGIADLVSYSYDPRASCAARWQLLHGDGPAAQPPLRVDPNIKHPRVDEWTAGFERELAKDVRLAVTGIYRQDKNIQASVAPDARWAPTTLTASTSGQDSALNGKQLTVYNWTHTCGLGPELPAHQPRRLPIPDAAGNVLGTARADRKYKAVMFVLDKRFSHRWQGRVSYVWSKNEGTVNNSGFETYGSSTQFESASRARSNQFGPLEYGQSHELKVYLTYQIPKVDIGVNTFWRYLSGWPYTPYQRFGSSAVNFPLSSGRQVFLEPRGSRRADSRNTLDVRLEKIFRLGTGTDKVSVYADFQNVLNAGTITNVQNRYPNVSIAGYDDPVEFGGPTAITPPRRILLGARWSF